MNDKAIDVSSAAIGLAAQPSTHPPISPEPGSTVAVNPPPMIWRVEDRAATYTVELARNPDFSGGRIEVEGIDLPFYNHSEVLEEGTWYWRYFAVTGAGERLGPGPVRRFEVPENAVTLPVPPASEILSAMPEHPRIFTTPAGLDAFRERRHGLAAEAWGEVEWRAQRELDRSPQRPENLVALRERSPEGPTPGMEGRWREGDDVRRQVFWFLHGDPYWSEDYVTDHLAGDAGRANILSFAYLISGDERYARAAKEWLLFVSNSRIDYHLEDRAQHDTVVYGGVETGLKYVALAFDRLYHHLTASQRERVLDFVEYHGEAAYEWLRERQRIHLEYQRSHPQQCMHALLTTALAVATHREAFDEWTDYLVRQYVNRIAWTSEDGGYFEGQTYAHKFRWILEGLAAVRTATGLDLFRKPRIRSSGDFWLYCMSLNYWFHHGGDVYSLLWPWGNPADTYISNLVASMNGDPYLQWWSDTVFANPVHIPLQYISETDLAPRPPVDVPQARAFRDTGQLTAVDRLYDHLSDRIFFRSSQWGGHSHAHSDQNNFVIHSGGEILAADPGYYTFSGDDYTNQWSQATVSHNSILVNGKGQPIRSIDAKGAITEFFNAPAYTFFAGDASAAYEAPLERFERAVLFIRPGFYVIYDELAASEPSEFTWLLNAFAEVEIRETDRTMTVPQQQARLRVRHLVPETLSYKQTNERPVPFLTRAWSRYAVTFPDPYHIRVTAEEKQRDRRFLALLNTYSAEQGDTVANERKIENNATLGTAFEIDRIEETVLFRRHLRSEDEIAGNGVRAGAMAAAVGLESGREVRRWLVSRGTSLEAGGLRLLQMEQAADVAAMFDAPGARGLFQIAGDTPQRITIHYPRRPQQVLAAPPNKPHEAREIPFSWEDGDLTIHWDAGKYGVLWVDPRWDIRNRPAPVGLELTDKDGRREIPMEVAVAEDGAWVAYAEISPREPGRYRITASDGGRVELSIQDRWSISESARGEGTVEGPLRDKTELFFRFAPGGRPPRFQAELVESHAGGIVNLLRNGDFEEGIAGYPPRGWVVSPTRPRAEDDRFDMSWPEWSREDSVTGSSALRFHRDEKTMALRSQPMRLTEGGRYVLRFQARGNATHARVDVQGARATGGRIRLELSDDWREYRLETDMAPGYTEIYIRMFAGGEPDQVLWIDDVQFGPAD